MSNETESKAVSTNVMPDLDALIEEPVPLSVSYWEPRANRMKQFRGVPYEIVKTQIEKIDKKTGEVSNLELEVVRFTIQQKDNDGNKIYSNIENGGCLLVDDIKRAVDSGRIVLGKTPLSVKYVGLKPNKNGNSMDEFRITPLA